MGENNNELSYISMTCYIQTEGAKEIGNVGNNWYNMLYTAIYVASKLLGHRESSLLKACSIHIYFLYAVTFNNPE